MGTDKGLQLCIGHSTAYFLYGSSGQIADGRDMLNQHLFATFVSR